MNLLMVISIVLLLAWSAFSIMHSRKKARQKALLIFSELIPEMEQYELSKSRTQFPVLSGIYNGYKVKLAPEVDNLVFQRLPRLYLRIYIYAPGKVCLRLRKMDIETQSNHLFLPNSFEKSQREILLHGQHYRLFLDDGFYHDNLKTILLKYFPDSNSCAEILFQKNFIRATILLSKGKQSSYIMTRSTDFDTMIFKREFFQTYFHSMLEIHKELNRSGPEMSPNSSREVNGFVGDA